MADPQLPPRTDVLPLSEKDLALWRGNISQARELRSTVQRWADANLAAYAPKPSDDPDAYGSTLNTNRDFTLVERKKADLFYQSPEVTAKASPLFEGHEALLDTHVDILNAKLGLHGVDAKQMVQQAIFDLLCPWGTGFTIMGYESVTVPTPMADPNWMDPGDGSPAPVVMAPVPVFEDCFWRWFSPKRALIPAEFHSTRWDDAPWLGMEFEMPIRAAKRKGWVAEDYQGAPSSKDLHFDYGQSTAQDHVARGVLIYYQSALYRDDRVHPQHLTLLVLMEPDGSREADQPAEHKDSPYQELDAKGALTPESLIGYPIHPFTTRTLTDASTIPSDCTISRPLVRELNRFRGQMVEQRDANILRWFYDAGLLPTEVISKMVRSPIGGAIGVPTEVFQGSGPEGPFRQMPHGTYPRENFQFNDYLDNDLARTHALDSNQQGVQDATGTTATEAQIQQSNVNARLGLERGNILDCYVRGVTKFSTLLQKFLSTEDAAKIVGAQKAQEWDSWRHQVPTSLAFEAMPDSALRSDTAADRKTATDLYSFLANDPNVNRTELLNDLLRKHHLNPSKIVVPPPPKGPEPAKPSFSFSGDDFNPLAPQFAIVMDILKQTGLPVSPQAVTEAQAAASNALLAQSAVPSNDVTPNPADTPDTQHGGKLPQTENLSRHAAALTGNMQGSGAPAPMGAGGSIQ